MKEFGASIYMARQAKKLVLEKGILSSPNPKPGKALPERIKQLVLEVYLGDEISRMLPGRKDCVSVCHDCRTKESKSTEKATTVQPERGIPSL